MLFSEAKKFCELFNKSHDIKRKVDTKLNADIIEVIF